MAEDPEIKKGLDRLLKLRRAAFFIVPFGGIPVVLLYSLLRLPGFHYAILIYIVSVLFVRIKLWDVKCPNCSERFFPNPITSFTVWNTACVSCGASLKGEILQLIEEKK